MSNLVNSGKAKDFNLTVDINEKKSKGEEEIPKYLINKKIN